MNRTAFVNAPIKTSMEEIDDGLSRKLVLILNYRRYYMVGFALNPFNNSLIIVDYVK